MNDTIVKVKASIDIAWMELDKAIAVTYDDGYSGLTHRLKMIQLQLDNLEVEIDEKIYGEEEDMDDE